MTNSPDALTIVPLMVTLGGIVTVAVCWPLMLGKVAPNRLYGIRTRAAFQSPENWYRLNRLGGRMFVRAGVILALTGLAGFAVPALFLPIYDALAGAITLAVVIGTGLYLMTLQ
jgi:uncharacterized membrane protein